MGRPVRLSSAQAVALTFAVAMVLMGGLFTALLVTARHSVVTRSEVSRDAAAKRIEGQIRSTLGEAEAVIGTLERAVQANIIVQRQAPADFRAALYIELQAHPTLAEVSLTHAVIASHGDDGDAILLPNDRWQIALYRDDQAANDGITTELVTQSKDGCVTSQGVGVADPTLHPTFATTVSKDFLGRAIWSDLHYTERDQAMPENKRHVVVTVQKAISDAQGKFVGVVRVGLRTDSVEKIAMHKAVGSDGSDPHLVFVCDAGGRLITRLNAGQPLHVIDDDLRVDAAGVAPQVQRALASPKLTEISEQMAAASESFDIDGERFLLTLRRLQDSQDWIVAVLVPEDYYAHDLSLLLRNFLIATALTFVVAGVCALLLLNAIHAGLRQLMYTATRMLKFDFSAETTAARLSDVQEVADSLERAKTAVRALGRYVPVALVKDLYQQNREPQLGGEMRAVTIMFSDLQGFTSLSEKLEPNILANALGHYLEAMTDAIQHSGGAVDKFIGDAVMAIWNAPNDVDEHALRACEAVLACTQATEKLFASQAWHGLPALVTRFGLHTDKVLVGHFGAPTRLNYTAIGDGVNLASRLESLGKQYGVTRIVSEAVQRSTQDAMAYRYLDRVAVKGKLNAVGVYELLGHAGMQRPQHVLVYEAALQLYFERKFTEAATKLETFAAQDEPSRLLWQRCQTFIKVPPAADWNGVWIAGSK